MLRLDLPGSDLSALTHFYGGVLGLPTAQPGGRLDVTVGWSVLGFTQAPRPAGHAEHLAFLLPLARFDAAADWLAGRCALRQDASGETRFTSESWGSRSVYFDDPDGNILELIGYPDWQAAATGSFQPDELLGLGEFGLSVTDVPATCRALGSLSPAPPAPDDATFMWVGGAQGRLIVARTGRVWFPDTGVAASPGPFRLELDGGRLLTEADLPG